VDAALDIASRSGLEGLTIGTLAAGLDRSKSGVFAHFGSREDLQLAVLEEGARRFAEHVFMPALKEPRGLPRLRAIIDNWCRWVHEKGRPGGCIFMAGAMEYDDRPGPLRDAIAGMQQNWRQMMMRAISQAVEAGDFRPDTDAAQVAFECYAIVLGLHHDMRLFGTPRRTVQQARAALDSLMAGHAAKPRKRGAVTPAATAPRRGT
jgi:AcrR family transcriptional regulator